MKRGSGSEATMEKVFDLVEGPDVPEERDGALRGHGRQADREGRRPLLPLGFEAPGLRFRGLRHVHRVHPQPAHHGQSLHRPSLATSYLRSSPKAARMKADDRNPSSFVLADPALRGRWTGPEQWPRRFLCAVEAQIEELLTGPRGHCRPGEGRDRQPDLPASALAHRDRRFSRQRPVGYQRPTLPPWQNECDQCTGE